MLPGLAGLPFPSLPPGAGPVAVAVAALVVLLALVAGVVLAVVAVDGLPASPPGSALREVPGPLDAERTVRLAVAVGVEVVLQPGGGLPPRALAAAGLRWLAEQLDQPGWAFELQRATGGAPCQPSSRTIAV